MMDFGTALLMLATSLQAGSAMAIDADRYALPATKAYIEACKRAALILHPGRIEEERMLYRKGAFLVRYEIGMRDGSEWLILCDGSTGQIVGEQKLIE